PRDPGRARQLVRKPPGRRYARGMRPLLLAALALLSSPPARANLPCPGTDPILLPAGFADAAGAVAYLAGATGGIEAIALDTGRVLFTVREATRPLTLVGDRLIVLATEPHPVLILVLARASGRLLVRSQPAVLPSWVEPDAPPSWGYSHHEDWQLAGATLLLHSSAPERDSGGT